MRILAKGISLLFHPLLILSYMLVILLLVDPFLFGISHISDMEGRVLLLRVFISTFFIPAFAVAMLTFLGLSSSIELPTREDRYGPYIVTGIFYLWMFRNFLTNPLIPDLYTSFVLGAVIGLFLAFFINIFSKISAHAVGMGGWLGMVFLLMIQSSYQLLEIPLPWLAPVQINLLTLFLILIFLSGIVGSVRLYLQAHEPMDLFGGFLIGFTAQLIAARFILFG
jgi:hypothetical protein